MAPESTRAAIREAVRAGAQMIELDVQMTKDGRLVIFHDDRLERTTNGSGRLRDARYAALARLDVGVWFGARFAGERILLASQALQLIPKPLRVNLELKRTPARRALLSRMGRLLRRARMGRRLLLSSFDTRLLEPLRDTGLPLALICRKNAEHSLTEAIRLRCESWHPHHPLVTPRRIARAHTAGLRVHVWTVDDPARARRLARWGVDGVFTNNPTRLRSLHT